MLPPPSLAETEHAERVAALLREHIAAAGGFIDFEEFMRLALYAPGLGYYSAGARKLGRDGDFVTAPELSDLFSDCVAAQCAQVLQHFGGGDVLEFGAGTGRMAAVLLQRLAALGVAPERYRILEVSADLAARQRERLAQLPAALAARVSWLERWPAAPQRGVMLANEVLDALPCQRFVVRGAGVHALGVALGADGALCQAERPASPALARAWHELRAGLPAGLPEGYVSELCPALAPWVRSAAAALEQGVLLLFDYGLPRAHYYHPERAQGTLLCHYRHRAHADWLWHPGLCDISAWVDFTQVAEAAVAADLEVLGFATQAAFLLGSGIEELLAEPHALTEQVRLAGEARRLLLPSEMGEAFKVMALGRGCDAPLRGFAHQDLRRLL